MKKLLILGAAVLGLCTIGQTARAGDDGPTYNYQRPAPEYAPEPCPPRVHVGFFLPPPPLPFFYPPRAVYYRRPHYRHCGYPYPYGYGYGYAPGVHIGIGF